MILNKEKYRLIMASLLHDVGKIVYRTGNRKKHAILGRDFLEAYFKDEDNKRISIEL